MWLIDDLRDFENQMQMLEGATRVNWFKGMPFKKKETDMCVYYGLYNTGHLVGYFWLFKMRNHPNCIKGFEFHVAEDMRRKGIGMFFYEHILFVDNYTVVTDYSHTLNSSKMWDKLTVMPAVCVGTYNALDDTFDFATPVDKNKVYNNDYMHFAAKRNDTP